MSAIFPAIVMGILLAAAAWAAVRDVRNTNRVLRHLSLPLLPKPLYVKWKRDEEQDGEW